ncbi:MAG: T9SS type B sorting domain-containing protein [Bacteroidota bacterium]
MKRFAATILLLLLFSAAEAGHITGGEMYYTYLGFSNGRHNYNVTLKYYKRCGSTAAFPSVAIVSVFDKTTGFRFQDFNAPMISEVNINLPNTNPCISNPPQVCFFVATYNFTLSVPASLQGYILASQINFRIAGITNLTPGYSGVGATFTGEIPGNLPIGAGPQNNSARFTGSDLVLVCAGNSFTYSFGATDPDGDELHYSFCEAYNSTASGGGTSAPDPPPYPSVPYASPAYSATQPLGSGITVNPTTGLIQGVAPAAGIYVVKVCVEEIRNGQVIAVQRKDMQINVADCSIASASLDPEYFLCGSTQSISLVNQSNSPVIISTIWEITDQAGNPIHFFSGTNLNYTFTDTGLYSVKLVINRNLTCADSTTASVKVYPGFVPDFSFTGGCVTRPTTFTDQTVSVYGVPDVWSWDFGEPSTSLDVSSLQSPVYAYPQTGNKTVRLIATDTRGCRDTVEKPITIVTGPPLSVAFRDTLICINDNLVLQATGNGNFAWSPPVNISNPNSPTPQVTPPVTTTYYVDLNAGGCTNRDSVRVRVVNFVTLLPMNDTTICFGDTTQLRIVSDGLQYNWTPAAQIINPFVQNPFVITPVISTYSVTAVIGGCSETRSIIVTPVPYPTADAGEDISVCYNAPAQLSGITDGSSWRWSPAGYVDNPSSLTPIAYPLRTTPFVFAAYDTRGCPKPGLDTVLITVFPRSKVSAGNDTAVIVGQPLQLNATGGISYSWSPVVNLSASTIPDPVAVFNNPAAGLQYQVTAIDTNGCSASAWIMIKVFKTGPMVFVPTAFTPNGDGLNDWLRPIGAGIKSIEYFSIYNRWGQLLFSTRQNGKGWDGRVNGALQATGTYVWAVKAVDYLDKPYFQKGVFTLIR